jgi:hypothetical protein
LRPVPAPAPMEPQRRTDAPLPRLPRLPIRWPGAGRWKRLAARPQPADGPRLVRQVASQQSPGPAAEARSRWAAPAVAEARQYDAAPEFRPWVRGWRPHWLAAGLHSQAWAEAQAWPLQQAQQPEDAAPGALPLLYAVGWPSGRRRAWTPATSQSSGRLRSRSGQRRSRHCDRFHAGSARARAAPHRPRASWSGSWCRSLQLRAVRPKSPCS